MRTDDFDYHLPQELIAQSPAEPRDSSRLMVLNRESGQIEHRQFPALLQYLHPGDVMVFNQSRVIPARLYGHRVDTGSRAEFLLLRRNADGTWQAIARPGRRLQAGVVVDIDKEFWVEIEASHEDGLKTVRLSTEEGIDRFGHTPLPPYICLLSTSAAAHAPPC